MMNSLLSRTYTWYQDNIVKSIADSMNSFFEKNFKTDFISASFFDPVKSNPLLKGDTFYTCQIAIKNKQHILLRLNANFIRTIFHDIFGSSSPVFELENLTDLEIRILNDFFEFLVQNIEQFLIPEEEQEKIDPSIKENVSLVVFVKDRNENIGKICVTIPLNRVKALPMLLVNNFEFDDFIDNIVYVNLVAGYAKISLDDLKNLSSDDILILDKSDATTMILKTPTVKTPIKVNPEPSIMIDMGDGEEFEDIDEENNYKEEYMPDMKTMWDDIQIEVAAEFQKVKMTLGELKQISKGLVIDVGPVVNNEISLLVENKTVAKGELVIINDKYGVKVTEVFASKKEQKPVENKPSQAPAPKKPQGQAPNSQAQPKPAQNPNQSPQAAHQKRPLPPPPPKGQPTQQNADNKGQNKEDFDYSNFEE